MPSSTFQRLSIVSLVVLLCWQCFPVEAQESTTTISNTPTKVALSDAAWIAGHWTGKAMGGTFEETWNPPLGNSMMGMFKFVKDDQVNFYELLTIVEENDSLVLRLKHFNPKLVSWEEKDESEEFPLLSLSANEARFDGLVFRKIDDSHMTITVLQDDGEKQGVLVFSCTRVE